MTNTMRVWNFGDGGKLISSIEVRDMDEARKLARAWNRGEKRPGMKVEIISNAPVPAHATKICAVI